MSNRRKWIAGLLAAVVLVGGIIAQLSHVHGRTGQRNVSVAAAMAPHRIHFQGRYYEQGGSTRLPRDTVKRGRTPGGGVIYLSADEVGTPLGVIVTAVGKTWSYSLVGGP